MLYFINKTYIGLIIFANKNNFFNKNRKYLNYFFYIGYTFLWQLFLCEYFILIISYLLSGYKWWDLWGLKVFQLK